jgi:hypothetical protein
MLQLYYLFLSILLLLIIITIVSSQSCPNLCNGRGRCNKDTRECICFEGHYY